MNEMEQELMQESIQLALRQQYNSKIKAHFEKLGYKVEIIELQEPTNINENFKIGDVEYYKLGYNFINTRKAYCIKTEVYDPEPEIEPEEEITNYHYQDGDKEVFPNAISILRRAILPFRQLYWKIEIELYFRKQKRKIR